MVHINYFEKIISLNVRSLSVFKPGIQRLTTQRSLKRAQIGQWWHHKLQTQTKNIYPHATFEVPIQATIQHRNWKICLEGRIDQVIIDDNSCRFIEVKSTYWPLPVSSNILLERYPDYFCQAITYACMAKTLPIYKNYILETTLLWIHPETQVTQEVPLSVGDEGLFYTQLESLVQYADERYWQQERKKSAPIHLPYPELRPEQTTLLEILKTSSTPIMTLEAPTGFGKTGVSLYWGLSALKSNHYTRIIYLTGKTTGQWSVEKTLHTLLEADHPLRVHIFKSKEAHAIQSVLHTCDNYGFTCHDGLEERLKKNLPELESFFDGPFFSLEKTKVYSHKTGICPYIISRNALILADIWISDYNYIFSPSHSGVFENQINYHPENTLLIIDEAHNLPQRVAQSLSKTYNLETAQGVFEALQLGDIPENICHMWERWMQFLKNLSITQRLDEVQMNALFSLSIELKNTLELFLSQTIELPPDIRLELMNVIDIELFLKDARFEKLIYAPENGVLHLTCLDARRFIRPILERFKSVLLMSATLQPINNFIEHCGLKPKQVNPLTATSPWRNNAYQVAVDMRINTRYQLRPQTYALTAETLCLLKQYTPNKPLVAFFPSYAYAQAVHDLLITTFSRIFLQSNLPTSLHNHEQTLSTALETSEILLLILGSRFTESIDILGGKITHALIAGPGLPAMTIPEEATRELYANHSGKTAFRNVYQIPALRKIHQAIGRLVRLPGQKAHILLHCERFAQPEYHTLLDPIYHPKHFIHHINDLHKWLN